MPDAIRPVLAGQKAFVVGVANDQSIAYGCAKAFRTVGAELAITWLNERARPYVEPLAKELEAPITGALDVSVPGQLEAIFDRISSQWGKLDILVHSIAFAPKEDLQGGLLNCSAEGFAKAMDVSCHSFVRMARLAAPLIGGWRDHVRHELLLCRSGSSELQRNGPGEGGIGGGLPLSGV
jgi:enoyl-[acyl-carrier protein] reductase I